VVSDRVDPRRRYQGGEPSEEIVGLEEQEERAATGALHPVDELAVLALREPLKREWRPDRVAAESLQPLAVVLVDANARVQREAVEAGGVALVPERVGEAKPPVHLGGLECGQGVSSRGGRTGTKRGGPAPSTSNTPSGTRV